VHFVSNPDAWALHSVLRNLDARSHAGHHLVQNLHHPGNHDQRRLRAALAGRCGPERGRPVGQHLVAITAAPKRSQAMGIPPEQTFTFWDWVGGRYSVWSALGLPLALAIGSGAFRDVSGRWPGDGRTISAAHRWPRQPARAAGAGWVCGTATSWAAPRSCCPPTPAAWPNSRRLCSRWTWRATASAPCAMAAPAPWTPAPSCGAAPGLTASTPTSSCCTRAATACRSSLWASQSEDTPLAGLPLAAEHHRVVNLNLRAQAEALARGRNEADTLAALMADGLTAKPKQSRW
jgi:glucose-6-phosphate isomerase